MGAPAVQPKIGAYFSAHPDRVITIDELVSELSLTRMQIQNAMNHADRDNIPWFRHIHIEARGIAWRYGTHKPAGTRTTVMRPRGRGRKSIAQVGRIFEEIGITAEGITLVRDENGVIYKIAELK